MFCLYTLDDTLNSDVARQALHIYTSVIVESTINAIVLAMRLTITGKVNI